MYGTSKRDATHAFAVIWGDGEFMNRDVCCQTMGEHLLIKDEVISEGVKRYTLYELCVVYTCSRV